MRRRKPHLGRPAHRRQRVARQRLAPHQRHKGARAGEDGGHRQGQAEGQQRARERRQRRDGAGRGGGEQWLQGPRGEVRGEGQQVGGCDEGEGEVGQRRVEREVRSVALLAGRAVGEGADDLVILRWFGRLLGW